MSKICRSVCVFLSVIMLFSAGFGNSFGTFMRICAADIAYYINTSDVAVHKDASESSVVCGKLSNVRVTKNGEKTGADGSLWYNITCNDITGYVRREFIKEVTIESDSFEKQLAAFPESYRSYLTELHKIYPNWKFYADNIDMTLDEAVLLELGRKVTDLKNLSWRSMDLGSYDWGSNKWVSMENGRWYYVSREVIKYYMDPRNFLNSDYIYTFLQQSYDPTWQTEEGLKKIVAGTFLERGYSDPKDTAYGGSYIKVLMAAAKESGVNPYILAGTIIQEQGVNGATGLISGTYGGYSGYYNFFNIGANGNNPTVNGLERAKLEGWNTRSKSIIGGAKFCGEKYVAVGQDTYFYMNYNIKEPNRIWHQYATAVHNAADSGKKLASTYSELKTAELSFHIPVYKNMPSSVSAIPEKSDKLNNYYFNSISVSGLTPSFDIFTYSYDLKISSDTALNLTFPSGASYAGEDKYPLKQGNNRVVLSVKSETGYINSYVVAIDAEKDCTLYIDSGSGTPPIKKEILCGDTNGDGNINGRDLANVQMHILNVKSLSGDGFTAGDTNSDGTVNGRDLANIQMHILGVKLLK